jgi:hypothetical protein
MRKTLLLSAALAAVISGVLFVNFASSQGLPPWLGVLGFYNSTPLSLANGQSAPLQSDSTGVLKLNCFVNCGVAQATSTSGQNGSLVQGAVTTAAPSYTTAQTDPVSLDLFGNTRVLNDGGCAGQSVANTTVTPINLAASGQILTGVSAKKFYICSINIVVAAANNVALVEGTGTVCATSIAGMAGGTSTGAGWNFAANGGLTLGNGQGLVLKTATAADNVCLILSSGTQVSGSVTTANF